MLAGWASGTPDSRWRNSDSALWTWSRARVTEPKGPCVARPCVARLCVARLCAGPEGQRLVEVARAGVRVRLLARERDGGHGAELAVASGHATEASSTGWVSASAQSRARSSQTTSWALRKVTDAVRNPSPWG